MHHLDPPALLQTAETYVTFLLNGIETLSVVKVVILLHVAALPMLPFVLCCHGEFRAIAAMEPS